MKDPTDLGRTIDQAVRQAEEGLAGGPYPRRAWGYPDERILTPQERTGGLRRVKAIFGKAHVVVGPGEFAPRPADHAEGLQAARRGL